MKSAGRELQSMCDVPPVFIKISYLADTHLHTCIK